MNVTVRRIPVIKRGEQRRGAVRCRLIDIETGVKQDSRGFEIMLLHGEEQRVLAAFLAGVFSVGIPRECPSFRASPWWARRSCTSHPRSLVTVPNIRAVLHQQAHRGRLAGRPHQGGLAELFVARVDVGAAIEQQLASPRPGPGAPPSSTASRRSPAPRSDRRPC